MPPVGLVAWSACSIRWADLAYPVVLAGVPAVIVAGEREHRSPHSLQTQCLLKR